MAPPEADFYVATDGDDRWSGTLPEPDAAGTDGPLATLARARDAAREMAARARPGDVTVLVRGGTYFLEEPLVFRPEDSGALYAAYPGETPVISGGRRVTGFEPTPDGRWTTTLSAAKGGEGRFRRLFVNGMARRRPRLPKKGFYRVAELLDLKGDRPQKTPARRFRFSPDDIDPSWTNLTDVEIVALHFWVDTHLPIASVEAEERIVNLARRSRRGLTDDYTSEGARYYVENVFEALTEPGEWYLDREASVLTYLPEEKEGETPETAEVIAPRLEQLVRFEGDPEGGSLVERIVLRGLTFSHTTWELPPDDAGDHQAAVGVPGAIFARGARDCAIEGCTLARLGTYAVEIAEGCSRIRVVRNEMCDLGAGGVKISGGDAESAPELRTGSNEITDNHIHHTGETFHSAVGVLLRHAAENTISHNHIHDLYYTGISVGWVWGYKPSVSRGNRIEFNHIHDIGRGLLSDMGGVYTLGVSPGTVVRHNLIHDVESHGYGGWGIYTDEGSTDILIENNVVYRTKCGGFHQHYGRENVVRNNVFALAREAQIERTRAEDHVSFTFERNIVYWREGPLLGKRWSDENFRLDRNLYFNTGGGPVTFADSSLEEWRRRGQDVHSLVADPLFVDPEGGDFSLKEGSPAFDLGFRPIDLTGAGPR